MLPEKWPKININDNPLVMAMASNSKAVDIEIHAYESNYDLVRYDLINDGIPKDNTVFIDAVTKSIERYGEIRYEGQTMCNRITMRN